MSFKTISEQKAAEAQAAQERADNAVADLWRLRHPRWNNEANIKALLEFIRSDGSRVTHENLDIACATLSSEEEPYQAISPKDIATLRREREQAERQAAEAAASERNAVLAEIIGDCDGMTQRAKYLETRQYENMSIEQLRDELGRLEELRTLRSMSREDLRRAVHNHPTLVAQRVAIIKSNPALSLSQKEAMVAELEQETK